MIVDDVDVPLMPTTSFETNGGASSTDCTKKSRSDVYFTSFDAFSLRFAALDKNRLCRIGSLSTATVRESRTISQYVNTADLFIFKTSQLISIHAAVLVAVCFGR